MFIDTTDERIFWPYFEKATKVHDWRNYVSDEYKANWDDLTPRERKIIIDFCEISSNKEEWD